MTIQDTRGASLAPPDLPRRHLARGRVVRQLDAAAQAPVTVVTAPAGWGKTVAIAEWARESAAAGPAGRDVCWLTVDAEYSCDIVERLLGAITGEPASLLAADETADEAAARLRVGLGMVTRPVTVVIDNAHHLHDPFALASLDSLVREGTGPMHLMLACRGAPALPLHRWRVAGLLSELNASDLSMSVDETARLLARHDLALPHPALCELHAVTEGWPAGVQLAAVAMRRHAEPARALEYGDGFTTGVAEYLTAEVIDTLPSDLRSVILDTAITSRLTAGLVDAITGQADGTRVLSGLVQSNTFVRRCAGTGGWYRYHPLFAQTLHTELLRSAPERLPQLHRRAAAWHAAYGLPAEAVRHSLLAADWARATEVLDRHWPDLTGGVRHARRHGVAPTPDAAGADPRLALAFAADRLRVGDLDGVRDCLQLTEQFRQPMAAPDRPPDHMMDAFARAEARLAGDPQRMLAIGQQLLRHDDAHPTPQVRAVALLSQGEALFRLGRLDAAGAPLRDTLQLAKRAGMTQTKVCSASQLAALEAMRGRLRSAAQLSREAMYTADRFGITDAGDLGWARIALAVVYYERARGCDADRMLDEALDLAAGDAEILAFAASVRAKVYMASGRIAEGLDLLQTVRAEIGDASLAPAVRAVLTLTDAELRVSVGDLGTARRLISTGGGGDLFPAWVAVIDASAAMAEGRTAAAAAAAMPHLALSEGSSLTWTVDAALITALAGRSLGDRDRMLRGLDTALELAELEGFRRPFVTGGHAVQDLLDSYAPALQTYRPIVAELATDRTIVAPYKAGNPAGARQLVDPLTNRELTILRYLQSTMSNYEIASTLSVSVNTVKTHVKHIYRKLHAGRRREAIRRARDLRLL